MGHTRASSESVGEASQCVRSTANGPVPPRKANSAGFVDIEFTIAVSDSDSSSVSEGGDDSDTTRAYRAHSMRRRKRTFNKQYGFQADTEQGNGSEIKATWEDDIRPLVMDRKGKGKATARAPSPRKASDNSATEESDDEVVLNQEETGAGPRAQSKTHLAQKIPEDETESELSDDISPLADPAGYSAQLARRAARRIGVQVITIVP